MMKKLFSEHLSHAVTIMREAMVEHNLESVWIHAGSIECYYLDDVYKPFWTNIDFNYYAPLTNAIGSWLYIDLHNKPKIYFHQPKDYWVEVLEPPKDFWVDEFDWIIFEQEEDIKPFIKPKNSAFIGEIKPAIQKLGFTLFNPEKFLEYIHYYRAYKSDFEIACIRETQKISYQGHQAAYNAFLEGKSEFDINIAFLQATRQSEGLTPYGNIVAINNNGATLHYTNYKHHTADEQPRHSFLLDAGVKYYGWTSDITRTFSTKEDEFHELIKALDTKQLQLTSELKLDTSYVDYHMKMHEYTADILQDFEFVKLNKQDILDNHITSAFFPHGLGHLMGLQCHDISGHKHSKHGCLVPPPNPHISLRCTRLIKPQMVFTVEPGFYFIDMLLQPWRESSLSKYFNWSKIDSFYKYGGVRIEDDVFLHADGTIENMTRDIFNK